MIARSHRVGPDAAHDAFEPHPTPAVEDCFGGYRLSPYRDVRRASKSRHSSAFRSSEAGQIYVLSPAISSVGQIAVRLFAIVV